jgi:ATP-dependent DNA ligase
MTTAVARDPRASARPKTGWIARSVEIARRQGLQRRNAQRVGAGLNQLSPPPTPPLAHSTLTVALRFIKHDGFRTLIAIEEGTVRAFTRNVY